ncbi:MAG: hypothetical protein HOL98_17210 [Gammaproteobacteria bacterium]|jgi:hypothetical protein|nr:hypothetical protein [Gammaproteobacteria bacterium]MBT5205202.1 hypothetical protein [Gammaproteobacteria bacterium]MBT5603237.1 hypothetical protein [Gammaproteobacteria bacterium]MBT6244777.1 hypothetical protein [Gammaproteobacteria bacterium]
MKLNLITLSAIFSVSAFYHPLTVYAEESSSEMEEIVVTSRRRDESQQDVPLSVTAFGRE